MAACGACGTANPPGFRYCGSCGSVIEGEPCPSCGQTNLPGQRFCGHCGAGLAAAGAPGPVPPVHERKLATVLFADVVGFTTLAESADPEDVARTVDGAFRRLGEVVAEHGGVVDKYMGDSVMAVFGVPQAHDDDAERAVAAALAMRDLGGELAFAIGINSGEVMATDVGRDGDATVIGDTVNVAARLEKAAGPGEVLVGGLTASLAQRRIVFRERPAVVVKGKREPVQVFEAVAMRSAEAPADGDIPLVGRSDELAFLEAQWRRVRETRQFSLVIVCGESGAGKTHLTGELANRIAAGGAPVVRAAYPAYGGFGGARLAASIIRQLRPIGDPQLDARVRAMAGELHPSLLTTDPDSMRQEQVWAFRRLLETNTATGPLLMLLDDAHRAGPDTLAFLTAASARAADLPVLLVLAGRSDPAEWLGRFPAATTLRLSPLGRADAGALAATLVGAPLDEDSAAFLVDRSGGNPLYLRELVAVLRDRGLLVARGGRLAVAGDAPVPATLQALLAARLDALTPAQKSALQHVAVLGDDALAGDVEALGLPNAPAVLRSLVEAGMLRQLPSGGYEVADPLLREVAYETLPRNVRGERHRRAGAAVADIHARARHLDRAARYLPGDDGLAAEAAAALTAAGLELLDSFRSPEGTRLLQRAVDLGLDDPVALLRLAETYGHSGDEARVLPVLARVPADTGDPVLDAQRAHVAAAAAMFTDPERAARGLLEVAERWRALGNVVKRGWAHANAGVALFNLSRFDQSLVELEQGIAAFREVGDRAGELATASFLALVRPTDPRVPALLAEALRHAEEAGDIARQMTAETSLAWHHYLRVRFGTAAEVAEAERHALRLAELALRLGADDLALHGLCLASSLARLTGRHDEAGELAERARSTRPSSDDGRERGLVDAVTFAAAAACAAAEGPGPEPPEVQPALDPVATVAGYIVAEALVLAGRFDEALAVCAAVRGRGEIGESGPMLGLAEPLAMVLAGRAEAARPLLVDVCRAARSIDAGPVVAAAEAVLAEVDGDLDRLAPPGPALEEPSGLAAALQLRARAVHGQPGATDALRRAAGLLRAPGLLVGIRTHSGELI